jgi:peptidoglycan/LPS O-acetylase OafA/YrhL
MTMRRRWRLALFAAAGVLAVAGGLSYAFSPGGWTWWIGTTAVVPFALAVLATVDMDQVDTLGDPGESAQWGPP